MVSEQKEPFVIRGKLFTSLDDFENNEYLYDDNGVMVVGNEGRILFVGSTVPDEYSHYQVVNTQHLIIPGFVDAHVH